MEDAPLTGGPRRSAGFALLTASCGLLVLQLCNIIVWIQGVDHGQTQEERVAFYLDSLPFGLGGLGPFRLTWLAFFCALISLGAGLAAGQMLGPPWKNAAFGLVAVNAVLMLWYLFTLM